MKCIDTWLSALSAQNIISDLKTYIQKAARRLQRQNDDDNKTALDKA